jgi:hypothetical protein
MKKFLTYFFVTLGVIFFILMCAGAYLWFADPYGVRPLIDALRGAETSITPSPTDKNPALSPVQEAALEQVGIDPAAVPTTITPAQEACATEILGAARTAEIKAGDAPTLTEIAQARQCFE